MKSRNVLQEMLPPGPEGGGPPEGSPPEGSPGGGQAPHKKVKLQLVGLDGNAFSLMGAFQRAARRQGWSQQEIKVVLDDCMSGDYNHLLNVLMNHCEDPDEDEEGFGRSRYR